jgi:hypothetical protein
VQKKKPVKKQTQKRWNKIEVENQAVIFLTQNPDQGLKDFCKTIKINYAYFSQICSIEKVYTSLDKIRQEKSEAQIKELKKQEIKSGVNQIIDYSKLIKMNLNLMSLGYNDLVDSNSNRLKLGFKAAGEGYRSISDIGKTVVLLDEKMRETLPPSTPKRNEGQRKQDERLNEFIEIIKNNNAENITNNTDTNAESENPTN